MRIIKNLQEWRNIRRYEISHLQTVGFVPTMGALHQGHLALIDRCMEENDLSVVSIFVNPTQFDDPSDFKNYPQTFEKDCYLLEEQKVDFVLFPQYGQLYPDNYRYQVTEKEFSRKLCGAFRSGHFDGVLTVVLKLLNLVKAHRAYFGEKDYQQFELIQGMADAFFLETQVVPCPTVREEDGLACSSRNLRLSAEQRRKAPLFYEYLSSDWSPQEIRQKLESEGFKVEYIEEIDHRRFGAVYLGDVRLIDNAKCLPQRHEETPEITKVL